MYNYTFKKAFDFVDTERTNSKFVLAELLTQKFIEICGPIKWHSKSLQAQHTD